MRQDVASVACAAPLLGFKSRGVTQLNPSHHLTARSNASVNTAGNAAPSSIPGHLQRALHRTPSLGVSQPSHRCTRSPTVGLSQWPPSGRRVRPSADVREGTGHRAAGAALQPALKGPLTGTRPWATGDGCVG